MPLLSQLSDDTLERPIYRIFRMEHALDLVSQRRLVLAAPALWDDPYENLLLQRAARQHGPDSGVVTRWYGGDLFGSCWTWISESDFGWRVYVPKGAIGVIVESTPKKLLSAVHEWGGIYAMRDCFVGEVLYLPADEILATIAGGGFQRANHSNDTARVRATALLLKRPEFQHEKEVRAVVECSDTRRIRDSHLVDVPVDPNSFIDSLTIDPRIDERDASAGATTLREAGYEGSIEQSGLYRLPWPSEGEAG